MAAQLEAFSANTSEFLGRERGAARRRARRPRDRHDDARPARGRRRRRLGHPRGAPLHRRATCASTSRSSSGSATERGALRQAGHHPAVVLGTVAELDPALARRAADVVVPADTDGHIAGLARLQDLGVDPVAFASSANPEDMALLLAHAHGAALVVAQNKRGAVGMREQQRHVLGVRRGLANATGSTPRSCSRARPAM